MVAGIKIVDVPQPKPRLGLLSKLVDMFNPIGSRAD